MFNLINLSANKRVDHVLNFFACNVDIDFWIFWHTMPCFK